MPEPIPDEIGVIVLPGAVLFPHTLLPLHIFEPRYRAMLERALESDRVFAVGTRLPGGDGEEPFPVGGAGVIRACVRHADGTSNLILQGLQRVRFSAWTQIHPYRIARVTPLVSRNGRGKSADRLAANLKDLCAALISSHTGPEPGSEKPVPDLSDADSLSDAVAATLVADPERRRQFFEELDVPTRIQGLMAYLRERLDQRGDA